MPANITVRSYTPDDFDKLMTIQREAFPPPFPEALWWNKEQITAHAATFREGAMYAEADGEPAGSATSLLVHFDGEAHTWEEVADNGYIRRSHRPDGDTLYGIDLCVRPKFRGRGIAHALYDARKQLVIDLRLKRYVAGCRIPNFHKHAGQMSVETYVDKVVDGEINDLVLSFMLRQGLVVKQIMPHYLDDDESLDYAVIVEWKNPRLA
ncbi:Acetyltransferase (GNAT) family protein [Evansella caseinilytica]|uniref:Acetyltransferase (GNAT) family protein n=1 Tax=Evansella caseinilytica TaxID=1503961 RepID=A0A1H3UYE1_9BACI|nr:GNAT family N-acetyltransferase [Evansella caseinilytica]SDZ66829.1 Acetyltransferase (GNAT) family protein [Evansella caseinilytica]